MKHQTNTKSCTKKLNQQQKQFSYVPYFEYSQQKHEVIWALSLNQQKTLLFAATKENVKVKQFKNGRLRGLQKIKMHSQDVTTMNILKSRSQYISGSFDSTICIGSQYLMSNPKYITKLKQHSQWVSCVILHPILEDQLMSGSSDLNIQIWSWNSFLQSWFCSQTICEHQGQIFSMSINQEGNQFISCATDQSILVMESSEKRTWQVKQKIKVNQWGFRLSFINNKIFVFQPSEQNNWHGSKNIHFYQFNSSSNQYVISQEIQVKGGGYPCYCYFPQIYIPSKQILLSKNGHFVNLIQLTYSPTSHLECNYQQNIDCKCEITTGTMSEDGEFLIIFNIDTKKIQIRKFQLQ
ncbi:unnamed protein product [Paramecium sonneborni]|uniref:Uncharacterized protein n=1 Tax=Paramecium sonneborni TaxID=65129 RepID=A0A8S1LY64_9CILI|nr:unnamed protein product [Paramecium sonneborni]